MRIILTAVILCGACLYIFAAGAETAEDADFQMTTDGALILERAGSNENIYSAETGEFTSFLRGGVVFLFEDVRMSAEEAVWQRNAGIIDFIRDVRVEQRGQVMTCNQLNFTRERNVLTALGDVLYQDSAGITFIRGNSAEYRTDIKECVLKGSPLLTRVDTTETDTLFISGRLMTYNDSLKIATVIDSVNIIRGSLNAVSEKAYYFADDNMAILRINPVILYEKHKIIGDSVDLFFGKESLESARVIGNTHGFYHEAADSSDDTATMNIWSDSLHLSMFESGKIDAMKAFGNARGDYSEISAASGNVTTTELSSDSMHMFMFESGNVRVMKAFGNARGNYSETAAQSGSAMATNISSDSLHVFMFESGKIRAMKAFGNSHGRNAEWSPPAPPSTPRDSAITHIWSDSLRVMMTEDGKIRTMRALGNVRSKNFLLGDSARANQITGNTMTLGFNEDGKIDMAVVRGSAKSVYFLEESDGGGANITSGDRIIVTFSRGKAQRLRVVGSVRGFYSP
ncbi:MAG: hypothetical protein LBC70_08720 [Chitinispirillales bacterium]|nr:hypothetical protein [Chitinispirillales bacterium]